MLKNDPAYSLASILKKRCSLLHLREWDEGAGQAGSDVCPHHHGDRHFHIQNWNAKSCFRFQNRKSIYKRSSNFYTSYVLHQLVAHPIL